MIEELSCRLSTAPTRVVSSLIRNSHPGTVFQQIHQDERIERKINFLTRLEESMSRTLAQEINHQFTLKSM